MSCACNNKKTRTSCDERLTNQKLRELEKYRGQISSMNPYGNPFFADLDDPYAVQLVQQINQFNNAWKSAEMPKKGVEKAVNTLNSMLNNLNTMLTYSQNASNSSDEIAANIGNNVANLGTLNTSILATGAVFNGVDYLTQSSIVLWLPPQYTDQVTIDLTTITANMAAVEAGNAVNFSDAVSAQSAVPILQDAVGAVLGLITGYQGVVNVLGEYQNTTGDQRTLLETNFKTWKDDRLCNLDKQIEETKYM